MNKSIYTLVSYLPGSTGWHDRCGDYHSGEESSLNIDCFQDHQSIGEKMAELQILNEDFGFNVLINGLDVDKLYQYEFLSEEEENKLSDEYDIIIDIHHAKFKELQTAKDQQEQEAKIKKLHEDEIKKQKEKDLIEKREREQLAQLMSKYSN